MIVEGFLAAGAARVYITARKVEQIETASKELGERVVAIPMDISTVEGCQKLADEIAGREERLDILVNNAGAAWGADYLDFPESGWDKVMDLNVKSPFFLTRALHGLLTAAAPDERPAKVINIGSIDGQPAEYDGDLQLSRFESGDPVADETHGCAAGEGQHLRHRHRAGRLPPAK